MITEARNHAESMAYITHTISAQKHNSRAERELHLALAILKLLAERFELNSRKMGPKSSNDYTHCLPRQEGVDALGGAGH